MLVSISKKMHFKKVFVGLKRKQQASNLIVLVDLKRKIQDKNIYT
jgi:hypothetical protein